MFMAKLKLTFSDATLTWHKVFPKKQERLKASFMTVVAGLMFN